MSKRLTRKSSDLEVTPFPKTRPRKDSPQPEPFLFSSRAPGFTFGNATSSSFSKNTKVAASISALMSSPPQSPAPATLTHKPPSNIADLKNLASSCLEDLNRHLDRSHSVILKDLEASQSRLYKRFKIHNQACQQVSDDADKEYKKISEQINESLEAMKDSYSEFTANAQASASRVCKTSISELSQSLEKEIAEVRRRFGISSA